MRDEMRALRRGHAKEEDAAFPDEEGQFLLQGLAGLPEKAGGKHERKVMAKEKKRSASLLLLTLVAVAVGAGIILAAILAAQGLAIYH